MLGDSARCPFSTKVLRAGKAVKTLSLLKNNNNNNKSHIACIFQENTTLATNSLFRFVLMSFYAHFILSTSAELHTSLSR